MTRSRIHNAALREKGIVTRRGEPSPILAAVSATWQGLRRAGAIERAAGNPPTGATMKSLPTLTARQKRQADGQAQSA